MGMEDLTISSFASFVPNLIKQHLALNPGPITAPANKHLQAAVLFTDISGYTALAEKLSQRRESGAEDLSRILNDHFGQLIALVAAHGGDVIKFAGDALLAIWPLESQGEGLATLTHRAAQCGLAIQAALHDYQVSDETSISLRIGISAGELSVMYLGGSFQRWELLVTGDPLIDVGKAQRLAKPGQVIIAPDPWEWIATHFQGIPIETERAERKSNILLGESDIILPLKPLPKINLSSEMGPGIKLYIPAAILSRLDAGQSGWLAELRHVTVLFVNLPDLNFSTPLEKAQEIMSVLQKTLYRYEGSINKLNVDDKGTTLVAAFGMPPMAHSDDAVRAVQAMQDVQIELRSRGFSTAIGIASGTAFCGSIGTNDRREYTLVGDVVNLAARLMQIAQDTIICDQLSYENARSQLDFEALPPVHVKGKVNLIQIYSPTGKKKLSTRPQTELIGRFRERAIIASRLQGLLLGTARNIVVLEGIAGIGKSSLVDEFSRQAQNLGIRVLIGNGDTIENSTPYHAWRPVFSQLFNLDLYPNLENRRNQVSDHLHSIFQEHPQSERLLDLMPLLNPIVQLDFPENEITQQMVSEVRAANTRELLIQVLNACAQESPLAVVIEDGHWLDATSWVLTWMVSQQVQPLILVITTRPFTQTVPNEYTQILHDPISQYMELETLSSEDALTLVCQRLGVNSLPGPVISLIREKAEGHPFFSEELAYALRDTGVILIEDGQCHLAEGRQDLSHLQFPTTVHGVITSRIDHLTPQQQLTLKVASVIGRIFAYRTLRDIHPLEADQKNLSTYLESLDRLNLTGIESWEPELLYIFKHVITQEVVYNLMLFSQRKQLHEAVARWYESEYKADLTPFYSILAHHWGKADEANKTIAYLEKAGELALHGYANQEAIQFFNSVLQLVESSDPPFAIDELRRASWNRQLGQAHHNVGNLGISRDYFLKALRLLKRGVPENQWALVGNLTKELFLQVLSRFDLRRSFRERSNKKTLLEAARSYAPLVENYYHANETLPLVYAVLSMTNITETIEPSPELAKAYANMCAIVGTIPLHSLARTYGQRARDCATNLNDLSALGYVLLITGVYHQGIGEWDQVEKDGAQASEISAQLGDIRRWGEALTVLATAANYRGQFARSINLFKQVYEFALKSNNVLQQAWALSGEACAQVRLGNFAATISQGEKALIVLKETVDRTEEIRALGSMAIAYLHQGQWELAYKTACQARALIALSPPTVYSTLDGYTGVAEVYLELWERESQAGQHNLPLANLDLKSDARRACKELEKYARVFSIGQPSFLLCRGLYEWLVGRQSRAQRSWKKSFELAKEMGMTYIQGRAQLEIIRHLPLDHPERNQHMNIAEQCLSQAEAFYELARLKELGRS
jgi:class 3 adenylate cyclase/tetratricopeptide (TPR) repeat protein